MPNTPKNDFLPFGIETGANVLKPEDYDGLAARKTGFVSGVAKSEELNTVWRQASVIAATFAQYIVDRTGKDVLDDGDMAALLQLTKEALNAVQSVSAGNSTHKPDASGNVKLGSAADADIVTSTTDTTAGRVPVVGWQGLGLADQFRMGQVSQFLAYAASDFKEVPANGAGWQSAYGASRRAQIFMTTGGNVYSRFSLSDVAFDVDTPWAIHYTTLNKPTAADVGAVAKAGDTMTGALTVPGVINTGDYFLRNLINRHLRFEYLKNDGTWAVDGYIYKDGVNAPNRRPGVRINCGTPDKDKGNTTNSGDWVFGEDGNLTCPKQVVPGNYGNFDSRYLTKSENLPVGIPLPWPTATPPSGWLICNGSAFNKTTCPLLAAVYPSGNLPDLRAQFIRGLDNGKNIDTGRAILSTQAGQSPYSSVGSTYGNTSWNSRATVKTGYYMTTGTDNGGNYQIMSESQAQRETRPTNVAFNYIVRAA